MALEIVGHGRHDTMVIEPGATSHGLANLGSNGGVLYSDTTRNFAESIAPKLAPVASICLAGCNTANDRVILGSENNISRQLSRELPNVVVAGYRGYAFGNEVSIPGFSDYYFRIGRQNYSLGFGRTYLNGEDLGQRSEFLFKNFIVRKGF